MKYIAHCVSGLQDIAWQQLNRDLCPNQLLAKEEGFLVFNANIPARRLASVRYLNICHVVIAEPKATHTLASATKYLTRSQNWYQALTRSVTRNERTFRIILSDENQLVSGDRKIVARVCATIERLTKLKHAPRGGDTEFWIVRRRSGKVFFCKRLSRRIHTEKNLYKGELRPELAHLLCLISEPEPNDVFLDPFTGSGAIPFARSFYPYNMIFAFDHDKDKVLRMKSLIKHSKIAKIRKRSHIFVHAEDALKLHRIKDNFIDKVVTDPPWGLFDRSMQDPSDFYKRAFNELCRVIKPNGLLILLMGDRELAAALSREFNPFLELQASFPLLVSGKKAMVCKWRKNSARSRIVV